MSDQQDWPERERLGREGRRESVKVCPLPLDSVEGQDLPERIEVPGLVMVRLLAQWDGNRGSSSVPLLRTWISEDSCG